MAAGVGLHMIVRDEAPVIARCLRNALPLVDWWVICDTGSTDGTQEVIRSVTEGVPGLLLERPWVSFGHNRQEALEAARRFAGGGSTYSLWLDADEVLEDRPGSWPDLDCDGYHLPVRRSGVSYERIGLIRLDRPWRWTGVVHEHLELPGATLGRLDRPWVRSEREGARAHDPATYRQDAETIAAALADEPDHPRLQFYLAQSWYDAGEWQRALDAYRIRVANPNGWADEAWFAASRIPHCLELLGARIDDVVSAHLDAVQRDPLRAEPLVHAARLERERGRHAVAVLYAEAASRLPEPGPEALFVDVATYRWRAYDELAVACYWSGRREDGLRAAQRALAANPDDARLRANLDWFLDPPTSENVV